MTPYFARTFAWIASKSAPEATSAAVPGSGELPAVTRPRPSHGCRATRGSLRRRFALPDADEVQKPMRPSGNGTIQVGVATEIPVFRNVSTDTYFSSATLMVASVLGNHRETRPGEVRPLGGGI